MRKPSRKRCVRDGGRCVPSELAEKITASVSIPTIGIGAGPHCDGQVLVIQDMLGMYGDLRPKFVSRYAELGVGIRQAVQDYCRKCEMGTFRRMGSRFIDPAISVNHAYYFRTESARLLGGPVPPEHGRGVSAESPSAVAIRQSRV